MSLLAVLLPPPAFRGVCPCLGVPSSPTRVEGTGVAAELNQSSRSSARADEEVEDLLMTPIIDGRRVDDPNPALVMSLRRPGSEESARGIDLVCSTRGEEKVAMLCLRRGDWSEPWFQVKEGSLSLFLSSRNLLSICRKWGALLGDARRMKGWMVLRGDTLPPGTSNGASVTHRSIKNYDR